MTPAQRGGYIQLLASMWNTEDCELFNDPAYLCKISQISEEDLRVVQRCFKQSPTTPQAITHKRLIIEREKQDIWRQKSSIGGKISAEKRANKSQKSKGGTKGGARVVQPKGNTSTSSSTSSSTSLQDSEVMNNKLESGNSEIGVFSKEKPLTPAQTARKFFNEQEYRDTVKKNIILAGCPPDIASKEINAFVDYWTEPNKSGTQVRWEMQKTFDVIRRLRTWFSRIRDFNSNSIHYVA